MTSALAEMLDVACRTATEHEARLKVRLADSPTGSVAEFSGTLTGPHSAYARTLTTDFRMETFAPAGDSQAWGEIAVVDPCYWTPSLPFLYELRLSVRFADGGSAEFQREVGVRRWQASGANLRLERMRTVLRGVAASADDTAVLQVARDHEASLLVATPGDHFCRQASRLGVGLVADVRTAEGEASRELQRLSQHASVLIVLCESSLELPAGPSLSRPLLANTISADVEEAIADAATWADVVVVELRPEERPPAWVAGYGRPVIAIRRASEVADVGRARNACDRLQAELAPEFDLAGYFVAP